ncbi:MAG TPA: hypothetical protein P5567_04535 [Kiritimatiellia bacterium]|nr:hypothetical protein [Verrucomicrobiota bacterium]HRZ11705.1 hypothetical protein [Kiritimatiellia bacterium]HSA16744.1 hypothetical protein [Kiritimatiellia bacterium]
MQSEPYLFWPEFSSTASIVAVVLALAIFLFGAFSGAWANKIRIVVSVLLATAISWFAMPLVVKAARVSHVLDSRAGVVIIISVMMAFTAAVAASIYEIITVTLPDVGLSAKK